MMLYVVGGLLLVLLIAGGASRPDAPQQILARLAAIVATAIALMVMRREDLFQVRWPLLFLLGVAALMIIQLIPMPPALWDMLPGRDLYRQGFALAGLEAVWRPLSLTPDRTLNALLALLPAFSAVVCFGALDQRRYPLVAIGLIAAVLLSALVGIVQISSGSLYLYRVTNTGSAVGFLANRNHQAVLLASGFPLLAVWMAMPSRDKGFDQVKSVLALVGATLLVAMLLATGSRAGLGLSLVSALLSMLLLFLADQQPITMRRSLLRYGVPLMLALGAVAATMLGARDAALQRLVGESFDDLRHTLRPVYYQMIGDFMPLGSGFGSFDPVFRSYEPYSNLAPAYINHTHNDYLEVGLEGGLPGAAAIAIFLIWFAVRGWRLWIQRGRPDLPTLLGRGGSIIVLILLASSAVDYPLRTPLLSFLFAMAAVWMLPPGAYHKAGKTELGTRGPIL